MKSIARALLLLVCIVMGTSPANAQNTIAITEFLNDSKGSESTGEWIELYNYGTTPVHIAGWTLVDYDTDMGAIPPATIESGEFLIIARDKAMFEVDWLAGIPNPKVVQFTGAFALSDKADEIVLKNAEGTEVWRIAYTDDDTQGRATYLTGSVFSRTFWGTKASPGINRSGTDTGGELGYETSDATPDLYQYSAGNRDWGSPLRGQYGKGPAPAPPRMISVNAPDSIIGPGVRGVALSDTALERGSLFRGITDSLSVAYGSSIRGVAGGLYADLYDWRTRVSVYHSLYGDDTQPRPTTLEFLRWARDKRVNLFITANTRGLVMYDPVNTGKVRYYTSDTATLAHLAADWVRYTNHIVPMYRQGDTITNSRDLGILRSLVWSSKFSGDRFDNLMAHGEETVPKVAYWEIGNEPTVSVAGSIGVSNGYKLNAADYYNRYKAIASAMKREDPSIKIGPCLVNGTGSDAAYITTLTSDPTVPLDFISYHPYQSLGDQKTFEAMEEYLGTVYSNQYRRWKDIRDAIAAGGRNPDQVEMVASEVNVSYWRYNETLKEGEMAHALGSVETVFVFARLGLKAAHYWIWPADAHDGTPYPVYKAYEKLRDYMGDRMLDFYTIDNKVRIYTTRDLTTGRIAIWALNFQNARKETVNLSLTGLSGKHVLRRLTLKSKTGRTSLLSANYSGNRPGGPRNEVDWIESSMAGADPANLELTLEPVTISVILISSL